MKLDANALRYITADEFRVLTAVELGQRNHEIVPVPLIESIAKLKHGGTYRCLKTLLRHHLVHHDNTKYDGFRLTYMGYDFLAIRALTAKGHIVGLGSQIGVGKESDIYEATNEDGETLVLKLHRLGRTSFRAVKAKRDYLKHRSSFSWLYLSRLAAVKEFAFMKALGEREFPVPRAIECNRHAVLMSRVDGVPLVQVGEMEDPGPVYRECMRLIGQLASWGLVHCDFNEFNLLIDEDNDVTCIDFPQMVSTSHANAQELFERDVGCINRFFKKKIGYMPEDDPESRAAVPRFQDIVRSDIHSLDVELAASGFDTTAQRDFDSQIESQGWHKLHEPASDPDDLEGSDDGSDNNEEVDDSDAWQLQDAQPSTSPEHQHDGQTDDIEEEQDVRAVADDRLLAERRKMARKAAMAQASRNAAKDKRHNSRRSVASSMTFGW